MSSGRSRGEVAVLGAGVAGLTAAAALQARDYTVTVYERGDQVGREACSWWAGGMLAPYCEAATAEPEVLSQGLPAADWWSAHGAEVWRGGTLVLAQARDRAELESFALRSEGHQWLDGAGVAALEPDLAGRAQRGLWYPDEAHVDPRQALPALARWLAGRGVRFELGQTVDGGALPDACIVDCRGLAAREDLPGLRGVRGEMILIRSRDLRLQRPIRLLHPRTPLYLIPRSDGLIMLGATSVESDHGGPVTVRSAMELLGAAMCLHPALGEAEIVEFGSGVRPAFAGNMPRLIRQGRITYFNGLYRHGYLLSPWYAEQLACQLGDAQGVVR
ncbi:FAD-dependent oxidoreductase [Frateuria aurantia]|uniref:D-amino-acid oxidase n=1 Tax=Frateuria aurantia (strain ATCC 33424 / DSM 6220 / KCTC 2777 / LMG 1558 / NBRC 3245 / NCIMB 13370) TaxID=767434 RepID=H8L688_FRAAD|nr:FAD-dependent oxidoreductase [Frateuria aurantia]AFC85934.1 glycine/D-amino acid oxidase, deaminating [Frateuria aurantia DSM 6220]